MPYFRHLTGLAVQHLNPTRVPSSSAGKSGAKAGRKRRKLEQLQSEAGPESLALRIQVSRQPGALIIILLIMLVMAGFRRRNYGLFKDAHAII